MRRVFASVVIFTAFAAACSVGGADTTAGNSALTTANGPAEHATNTPPADASKQADASVKPAEDAAAHATKTQGPSLAPLTAPPISETKTALAPTAGPSTGTDSLAAKSANERQDNDRGKTESSNKSESSGGSRPVLNEAGPSTHDPSHWAMFIDGTAAVFGLLSAIVAIGAIVLAVSGIQGFRSIKNSITEEVNDHVQKELKRQVTEAISGHIQAEIQGKLDILIAAAVKSGETRINAEIARIQVEAAVRNELVEQVAAAVTATLKPQPSRTTQDEFEPPKA